MDTARPKFEEQKALWNGLAGRAWVESREVLDKVLAPFEELLVRAVSAEGATSVLDVGCGTGSTTLAMARRLPANGKCAGVDISEPMISVARVRAELARAPASFLVADAQTHAFEPASFDAVVSRFGVMFFDDPVEAFTNLRRAAKAGALLLFFAWRSAAENPFMTTAERAAAPHLPQLPARRADEPGQFAFADPERVRAILEASGWSEIATEPVDQPASFSESELVRYLTRMGPVGRVLQQLDPEAQTRLLATMRAAFDDYVHGPEVRFVTSCWRVSARA